jgi:hypothetical protein
MHAGDLDGVGEANGDGSGKDEKVTAAPD